MAIFAPEFKDLNDLFVHELEDAYDAEQRLIDALPQMADAAHSPDLAAAFREHLEQTREHVNRLDGIFRTLGREPHRETCEAMKGLIREGQNMIQAKGDETTRDAALITAAQRVEHYEMAVYGSVRTYAKQLGLEDVARTLQQTLDEEGEADKKLTSLAENVNVKARM